MNQHVLRGINAQANTFFCESRKGSRQVGSQRSQGRFTIYTPLARARGTFSKAAESVSPVGVAVIFVQKWNGRLPPRKG